MQALIDYLLVTSTAFAAIAAIASAIASWRAPRAAAMIAEELRRNNDREDETRKQKEYILRQLLMFRGSQISREGVAALNLIDVIFSGSSRVRNAWATLYSAYNRDPSPQPEYIGDKLHDLIRAVCDDLGLSDDLTRADLERFYYPNILLDEDRAENARRKLLMNDVAKLAGSSGKEEFFPPSPAPEG